eukprot:TRINITY_DN2236_c0_g1_i3.p1 TRINITY_DN2236_c0_g1~~TRINITY_DN2236_c0_g1_i3.p1  ORF type:complete len:226 (+),score=18.13 TRINITY_DN2236_c0_g1_i3:307-984(+)
MYGAVVFSSVYCFAYGQAKQLVLGRNLRDLKQNAPPIHKLAIVGSLTGFCTSFVNCPIDLIKSKLQVQRNAQSSQGNYKSSVDCFIKIFRQFGVLGLYQGITPTLVRNTIGDMFYFGAYEITKHGMANHLPDVVSILLAGSLGGVAFWTFIYPIDVVKSLMQTDHPRSCDRKYKSMLDCIRKVYSSEGFRGFWKGYGVCVLRSVPTNAFAFLAYEYAKDILRVSY